MEVDVNKGLAGQGAIAPDQNIARPELSTLRHPENCVSCRDMWQPFVYPGHPDDGKLFACGIMVENEEAGCYSFHCPYRRQISEIIDAEAEQKKALNKALDEGRFSYNWKRETVRPVIIAEEAVYTESPHPWFDPVMERAKFESELVEKLCGICPDCTDCGIAGDPNAMYRCAKLREAIGR